MPTTRLLSRIGPLRKKLSICPNAGYPTVIDRQMVFPTTPTYFGEQMRGVLGLGANLVGGCCGTTPLHIKKLSQVVAAFCQKAKKVGSITKDGGIQQTDEGADNQATAKESQDMVIRVFESRFPTYAAYQRFDNGPAHRSQSHFAANDTRSETHCRRI